MQVERVNSESMTDNRLPDGSRILVDAGSEKVFALNATAGAAWDACSAPATLAEMTAEMQRTVNPSVSEELAAEAIRQLEEQKLVRTSGAPALPSRRAFMGTMTAVATLPVVAALTMTEQRAYARNSASIRQHQPAPPPPSHHHPRWPWSW
jgi:hypothetical protein